MAASQCVNVMSSFTTYLPYTISHLASQNRVFVKIDVSEGLPTYVSTLFKAGSLFIVTHLSIHMMLCLTAIYVYISIDSVSLCVIIGEDTKIGNSALRLYRAVLDCIDPIGCGKNPV